MAVVRGGAAYDPTADAWRRLADAPVPLDGQQINAAGRRVGINRPDLQYTVNGQRYHIEYEGVGAPRGPSHTARITANDPTAIVSVREVP